MAYLPKHYVKTGLTANPGAYIDRATGQPYSGPYYAIATGQFFAGLGPQDPNAKEILPFGNSEVLPGTQRREVGIAFNLDVINIKPGQSSYNIQNQPSVNYQVYQAQLVNDYTAIKKYQPADFKSRLLPYGVTPIPDSSDYKVGEYRRYFCKKTNESTYLEIDEQQFTAISGKDPKFFWEQYFSYSIPWALTGEESAVYQTNKNIVQRRITNLKLFGFERFLREDYTKFYKYTEVSNLYTTGGEFKTTNGQNYIGDYHIHDSKGPMVGKTHTRELHELLLPVNQAISSRAINQQTNIKQSQSTGSYNPTSMNAGGVGGGGGGY